MVPFSLRIGRFHGVSWIALLMLISFAQTAAASDKYWTFCKVSTGPRDHINVYFSKPFLVDYTGILDVQALYDKALVGIGTEFAKTITPMPGSSNPPFAHCESMLGSVTGTHPNSFEAAQNQISEYSKHSAYTPQGMTFITTEWVWPHTVAQDAPFMPKPSDTSRAK